jgi:CRP-like cAMP-binding protein
MAELLELLRRVPAFADLPDDQIAWFLSQSQEQFVKAGESYARQGEPADQMFILLEGEFQWRGELAGDILVFDIQAGEITGLLPFSRMKKYGLTGRAMTNARVLRFPASRFPDLVQRMPELTTRLVGLMSDRIRETTRFEQQRDRLAALGKLSAGLAHELNNPASAAKRATSQLRDILKRVRDASLELGRRTLTGARPTDGQRD